MRTSDEPLLKTTLNLYEADVHKLQALYGYGWTQRVREVVHDHIVTVTRRPLTIGDIADAE